MNIFDPDFSGRFKPFSASHIITMIFIAIIWILLPLVFKNRKTEKSDNFFRYILAFVLIGQYLGWMLWEGLTGRFTLQLSLPLNLCDLSNFLCAVLLLTKSKKLYEILFFWALAGTIQSYITPNIFYGFPHFEFIAFYIQHGGEILTILYITIVWGYRPRFVSIFKSMGFLMILVFTAYVFNYLAGSNYMFLMADTPHPSTISKLIKIFGEPPFHMIGLTIVALLSHFILYAPFGLPNFYNKVKDKYFK